MGMAAILSFDSAGVPVSAPDWTPQPTAKDSACLGPSLSDAEARSLCDWGISVLGAQGTVFKAACRDIVVDAGAAAPDRSLSMVDMVVASESTCVSRMRTGTCSYTVEQFKRGIDAFHNGDCGAGAGLSLVDYL
jgi:hypothetical protein